MEWLGSIGGIRDILMQTFIFLFGGYAQYNGVLSTLNLFHIHQLDNGSHDSHDDGHNHGGSSVNPSSM